MFIIIEKDTYGYSDGYSVQNTYGPFLTSTDAREYMESIPACYSVEHEIYELTSPVV